MNSFFFIETGGARLLLIYFIKIIIIKVQSKTKGTKRKKERYMPLSQVSMSDAQLFFVLRIKRANPPLKVSLHFPT
jgi:hypothetical protein